jgi:hypothetical protein
MRKKKRRKKKQASIVHVVQNKEKGGEAKRNMRKETA